MATALVLKSNSLETLTLIWGTLIWSSFLCSSYAFSHKAPHFITTLCLRCINTYPRSNPCNFSVHHKIQAIWGRRDRRSRNYTQRVWSDEYYGIINPVEPRILSDPKGMSTHQALQTAETRARETAGRREKICSSTSAAAPPHDTCSIAFFFIFCVLI